MGMFLRGKLNNQRFGFDWSIFHQAYHKVDFKYDISGDFNDGYNVHDFKRIGVTMVNIKHVHQLQNLYFALTGKELVPTTEKEL